jgi:glutaredoxin
MKVLLYSVSWCGDCRAARNFLKAHDVEFTEIDIDRDREASAELVRRVGKRAIPQLVIDGEWFQPYKPGRGLLLDELHDRLGIPRESKVFPLVQ